MGAKEIYLTPAGLKELEEELEQRRTVRRREIAERIKQAIEFGDLGENSEYEDAKREQGFNEGSIIELEKMLAKVHLIDRNTGNGKIVLGSSVVIENVTDNKTYNYTIVGSAEANPSQNKISDQSPVGKALLGATVGSEIEVTVPVGVLHYRVLGIDVEE